MKHFLTLAFALVAIVSFSQVHVRSYTRKDGTFVQAHERTKPDATVTNNYSYPGNYNPNTNKITPGNSSTYSSNSSNTSSSQPTVIPAYTSPSTYTPSSTPPIFQEPVINDKLSTPWVSDIKPAKPIKTYYSQTPHRLKKAVTPLQVPPAATTLYVVSSDKAFFYVLPIYSKQKKAYLTKGEMFFASKISNGFVYVNFTNSLGQITRGWISKFNLE